MSEYFWSDEMGFSDDNKSSTDKIREMASKNEESQWLGEAKKRQALRDLGAITVRFKKLNSNAKAPCKKNINDAGWDLTVSSISIKDGLVVYDSGIAVEIPSGYVGLLFPRSSIANTDLLLSNSVGVIDSCYRGSIMAKFIAPKHDIHNRTAKGIYDVGDRFCQLIIMPYPSIEWEESDALTDSERGTGGYGSTGV